MPDKIRRRRGETRKEGQAHKAGYTAISRPGGYEVYRLDSNMPLSQKRRKPLQAGFLSLLQSKQKEILKRGMTSTEPKPKSTTFKVQLIAIANPLYIDLIHQWETCDGLYR